ncbi:hypothetical protein DL95DRAFT_381350 [Leptodontidium sp. 2 PMI_412]|nr:hypothetical protein DL95DRAFT_381350 [Leptodontidium sp. 2 PMI_412]
MASDTSATSFDNEAKRAVLRLKVSDFEGRQFSEYVDAIKAYLLFANAPPMNTKQRNTTPISSPFSPLNCSRPLFTSL